MTTSGKRAEVTSLATIQRHFGQLPPRSCTQVGPGDFVLTRQGWARIATNTAHRRLFLPRTWTVITEDGRELGIYDCLRYAYAKDLE